jgi:tetratricopeptide (TPR) repeat protein
MERLWIASFLLSGALVLAETPKAEPSAERPVKTKIQANPDGTSRPSVIILDEEKIEVAVPAVIPGVEAAIPGAVMALGEPSMMNFPAGIQMAVTAATEKAQAHVNQGMNHLHGGWEFEASRHFAAAMKEDPECLLAHWGMLITLLAPSPESDSARVAVTARLLDLVDQGKGTELERGYCYGLIKYLEAGPAAAAGAFRKVAAKFPNDIQATIFAALFSRGGYDDFGTATPDQEAAEKSLEALIEKNPESPLPLNALLSIRADGPELSHWVDLAVKLTQMSPDYPPYFHLLGHYEWRSGHHGKAVAAFGRSSTQYESWMKANQATVADCPEWVKAECYRIVSMISKGDFETGYAAARRIAVTPAPKGRMASTGVRLLLWEAKTLPVRILLHRNLPGNAGEALASLPSPEEMKAFQGKSLAYWWIDGLRFALEARRLIDRRDFSEARAVTDAMGQHGELFSKSQSTAAALGERSSWTRGFRALEVLASDLRGRLALAGPEDRMGTAYNWFASAADRQRPAIMMFPPMLLTPMAIRLGEFYLAMDQPQEAIEAYQRALTAFPNDMQALLGLKLAYDAAKLTSESAATEEKIRLLRAQ